MLENFPTKSKPSRYKNNSRSPGKTKSNDRNYIYSPNHKNNVTKWVNQDIESIIQKYIQKKDPNKSQNENLSIINSSHNHQDILCKSQECGAINSYIETYSRASHIFQSSGKIKNKTLSQVNQKASPTSNVLREKSLDNSVKSSYQNKTQSVNLEEIFLKIDNQQSSIIQKNLPFPVKLIHSRQSAERETFNSKTASFSQDQENEISKQRISGESIQWTKSPFEKLSIITQENKESQEKTPFQVKSLPSELSPQKSIEQEKSENEVEFGDLSPLKKDENSKSFEKLEVIFNPKQENIIEQKQLTETGSLQNQQQKIDELIDQAFLTSQTESLTEPPENVENTKNYILESIEKYEDNILPNNLVDYENYELKKPIIQPIVLRNQLSTIEEEDEIRNLLSTQPDQGENSNPLLQKLNSMINEITFKLDGTSKLTTQQHVKLLDIEKKYGHKSQKDDEIFQDFDDKTPFEEEKIFNDNFQNDQTKKDVPLQEIYHKKDEEQKQIIQENHKTVQNLNLKGEQQVKCKYLLSKSQFKKLNILLRLFFMIIILLQLKDFIFYHLV